MKRLHEPGKKWSETSAANGKVVSNVKALFIQKFGSWENVNQSELVRETGLSINTIQSWVDGTVTRFDLRIMAIWMRYFELTQLTDLMVYVHPRKPKGKAQQQSTPEQMGQSTPAP